MKINKLIQNYKVVYPAEVVVILEGNGKDIPFNNVEYVLRYTVVNGIERLIAVGKILQLTEEEKSHFGKNMPNQFTQEVLEELNIK